MMTYTVKDKYGSITINFSAFDTLSLFSMKHIESIHAGKSVSATYSPIGDLVQIRVGGCVLRSTDANLNTLIHHILMRQYPNHPATNKVGSFIKVA